MTKRYLVIGIVLLIAGMLFAATGKNESVNLNDPAYLQQLQAQLASLNLPTLDTPEKIAAQINRLQQAASQSGKTGNNLITAQDPESLIPPPGIEEQVPDAVLGKITGTVTRQSNNNAINNAWVYLYNSSKNQIKTTKTNSSGVYNFNNLSAGTYYVRASGWTGSIIPINRDYVPEAFDQQASLDDATPIVVGADQTVTDINLTLVKYGKISGKVTLQSNGDNVLLAGVMLFDSNWNLLRITLTGANGNYKFEADLLNILLPGSYYAVAMRLDLAHEYWNEAPFDFEASIITVGDGEDVQNINFTLQKICSIGDTVWEDINGNGVRDPEDPAVPNAIVHLRYKGHDVLLSPETTGPLGWYLYIGLPPVDYTLEIEDNVMPYGYIMTHGTNPWNVSLAEGENNLDVDFGIHYCWGTVAGYVYNDKNLNGIKDENETGIEDATVLLKCGAIDGRDNQTDTGPNGFFRFKKVHPGDFHLQVWKPSLPQVFVQTAGQAVLDIHVDPCGGFYTDFFYADPDTIKAQPCDSLTVIDGSPTFEGEDWSNAVDGDTTGWDGTVTTRGAATDLAGPAWAIFEYTCKKMDLFNQILIKTDNGIDEIQQYNRQAKTIVVYVSTTTAEADSFKLVDTLKVTTPLWQVFNVARTQARYIKLVILQPTKANGAWRQLVEFATNLYEPPVAELANEQETVTAAPTGFELAQNYPNPFNPQTSISYSLAKEARVELRVFDMNGHEVATLVNGQQAAGQHTAVWSAQSLPSGTYFYQLTSDGFQQTKRMVLLK